MSAGASPQTPLGSAVRSPRRSPRLRSWLKWVASLRRGWNEREGLEGGVEREERGRKGGQGKGGAEKGET